MEDKTENSEQSELFFKFLGISWLCLIIGVMFYLTSTRVYAETFAGTLAPGITYKSKTKPLKLYTWQVLRVVDGDTLEVHIPSFPDELTPLKIRVIGIDTPEKGLAKCKKEKELGYAATKYTADIIEHANTNDKSIKFGNIKWDKYGGRIDADVFIGGKPLSEMLIKSGYARPYDARKKSDWCN